MTLTFQPQFIKQDSAVPLRMMVGGWAIGIAAIVVVGPVSNRLIAVIGITLLAGGLIMLTLKASRTWRMVLGSSVGAFAAWLGYRFAFPDRILAARDDPLDLLDRDYIAAIAIGLSVLAIGLGGLLEALRAQAAPGSSPMLVRVLLVLIGMGVAAGVCLTFEVSGAITALVAVATGIGLVVLTWLRRERPTTDFIPRP
jgi:hypothetical protein